MPTAFFLLRDVQEIMNIVLIGYRCSGKSCVGRVLAGNLNMPFLDTDRLIEEKTGMSVPDYILQRGWPDFRRMERKAVEAAALEKQCVIAAGGGVVMDPENVRALKQTGWLVWLSATPGVIRERMALDRDRGRIRPPLGRVDALQEIEACLGERMALYKQAHDFRVKTDCLTPKEVAQAIMEALPAEAAGSRGRTH